jgi:hypothetical protein
MDLCGVMVSPFALWMLCTSFVFCECVCVDCFYYRVRRFMSLRYSPSNLSILNMGP